MKPVLTVTPNPALDLTIAAPNWRQGRVNRAESIEITAGGKGLSVAINLQESGLEAVVTGWIGSANDIRFRKRFEQLNLKDDFIRIEGEVRRNIKIVDEGETTDINTAGQPVSAEAYAALIAYFEKNISNYSALVMGGSLPPKMSPRFYADMVERYAGRANLVVVDTSDAALAATLAPDVRVLPDVIKPNIHELSALCGQEMRDEGEILRAAREYLARGVKLVVVSMGEEGALFVSENEALHAQPPKVKVASTVGAGDAMVAGIVRGALMQRDLEYTARTATAFAAGNILHTGVGLPDAETLENLKTQTRIRRI